MRNIKSTLRFARNSALLFVAASGMAYLSACSETDINPDNGGNNGDDNVLVESLKLSSGSNPNLAKTYPNSRQMGTRANDVPEHPNPDMKAPSEDELNKMNKIVDFFNPYYFPDFNGNPCFYIPAGTKFELMKDSNHTEKGQLVGQGIGIFANSEVVPKYYIAGDLTISGTGNDNPMEIHILNGGKLTDNSIIQSKTTIYLYGGGDILQANQNAQKNIHIEGTLIATGNLSHDDVDMEILGDCYTTGKIHGKNVTLVGGEVYAGCAVTAKEQIYLTGETSHISAGYVSAPKIELAGGQGTSGNKLEILLRAGGYLHATESLNLKNYDNIHLYAIDGQAAMVHTDVLDVNGTELIGTFSNVAVKYNKQIGTQEAGEDGIVHLVFSESVKENGEITYEFEESDDECAPITIIDPNDPDEPKNPGTTTPVNPGPDPNTPPVTPDPNTPVLENIGSIEPVPGHEHPISATCIFANGKDAYLSWHTQGPKFHGCIEYITVDNGTVTLNSYLETSPANDEYGAIDFNHVIFDNNKIFVAGDHPKKGGILGWIHCNNGAFATGNVELNLKELYNGQGGSGNCIIRNGDYYQVASVKGFETYNVNDFNIGAKSNKAVARLAAYDFDPAGESASGRQTGKHIATDGQNVVMLTLINRDNGTNTAKASIKVYAASDITYKNAIASYIIDDEVLSPVDGKDVIAIQGNDIWVCLGKGGVQHLTLAGSTISRSSKFVLAKASENDLKTWGVSAKEAAASCANGLAVKDNYVYVAHGGAGLVVLNKDDLKFVTRSRHNGGNSANYVNVHPDGYIYVAYGKSKVQVFGWKQN